MKVIDEMVDRYVSSIIVGYADEHGEAPDDPAAYDGVIEKVRYNAVLYGHLEDLKLGLEVLLSQPGLNLERWLGATNGFEEKEVRDGMERIYSRMFPDSKVPAEGPPGVELIPCPWPVWNVSFPGHYDPNAPPPDLSKFVVDADPDDDDDDDDK